MTAPATESNPETDLAVTDRRAAEILGVCQLTIRRMMTRGELPSFLVGRARRIWLSDIRAFSQRSREIEQAKKAA